MSNYSQYALIYVTRPAKTDQFGMKDVSEIITQYNLHSNSRFPQAQPYIHVMAKPTPIFGFANKIT